MIWGWVWRCEHGHECAVSEAQFRQAYVRPRCSVTTFSAWGDICGGRLEEKVFPLVRTYGETPPGVEPGSSDLQSDA